MKKTLIAVMALGLFAACNNGSKAPELTSGIDKSNMDTTANPADNFYQYACGGWMEKNPLTDEYSRYGSFDKLAEDNREQLKSLIEEIAANKHEANSIPDKIATLYNMGMDSTTLNNQGAQPIEGMLKNIAALATTDDLQKEMTNLHINGINPFFGLFAEADYSDSKMTIAWLWQTGIAMGDRDYYLKEDDHNKELRAKYTEMIANMFTLSGYDKMANKSAEELAQMVMYVETRLAKASYDKEALRDPYKTFHKMSVEETDALAKDVKFAEYFKAIGLPEMKSLNVGQPEYITEANEILKGDVEKVKAYFAWNVINTAAGYLSDNFVKESFKFYGTALSGKEEMRPRWKRVTGTVDGALGEAVGQMYVEKYFPKEAKDRMLTLVDNLKTAFGERIQAAAWMNDTTKQKALEKLGTILVKVGYPDKWRDYSGLEIKGDSYFANILRSNQFDIAYMINKIDKPTDKTEWLMTPQTVNAYYNPTTNEICFPAGILQPPFFDMNADDAVNYGAIGVVIGHEMTHGFDDQGRQYDKDGNLKDWWTAGDAENFTNNAQVLVDWFNAIKVSDNPETYANGKFTLGENIADNGGLQISYQAMQNAIAKGQVNGEEMDGFSAAQRFFIAYAGVWAGNIREQEILRLTAIDPHSLGRLRVNATLPHIAAFIQAFDVKEGDSMYLAPEKQVVLW
ncbi:MAG: M13 family metallopeptidase [Bacteroidales bacterium]|nr:M13 family metallopeptidase [Bacteroidales bacterium]